MRDTVPKLDLGTLNNRQRQAVTAGMRPLLVLAGAGSGKTRVLAYRIAYLVAHGLVSPEHILALTFTNKAAKEMQERVGRLLSEQKVDGLPTLSTFHSLGVKILRLHGYVLGLPKAFSIIDNEDQLKVLKDVFALHNIDESVQPRAVLHFIHTVKNTGLPAETVAENVRGYMAQQVVAAYYGYQTALHKQGSVDLDDLIVLPVKLFVDFPEVLRFYQDRFRYILVDEYQDTNPIQYQFLKKLCPPAPLFVVGDDAQSIYGFRGSDITNILNFERDFPDSEMVVLDQNYRSTQNILAVADSVLKHSLEQKPKTLWTENDAGPRVIVKELSTEVEEADFIISTIIDIAAGSEAGLAGPEESLTEEESEAFGDTDSRPFSVLDYMLSKKRVKHIVPQVSRRLPADHRPLKHFAVLYRTHAQSRALEAAMLAASMPYKIVGGVRFFDRKEVKDALSFLRILQNIRDFVALSRAAGVPPKGIGDKTLELLRTFLFAKEYNTQKEWGLPENQVLIEELRESLAQLANAKSRGAVSQFLSQITNWLAVSPEFLLHDVLDRILKESGLLKYYADEGEAGEVRIENLQELVSVARKFGNKGWQEALPEFLEEVALMSDVDAFTESEDAVTLMTLHAAKGLEYDVVFFAGLEEGLLPHSRSMLDPKAFAEEVRLAYVGVTRAKQRLYLTYVRQRGMFGESRMAAPSRLLRALPEQAILWRGRPRSISSGNSFNDGGVEYEPFEE